MFTTFDAPDASISCARRDVTTVAPQALAMLNSVFMFDQAKAFAARLQKEYGQDPRACIQAAWQLSFGRAPTPEEIEKALELFAQDLVSAKGNGSADLREPADTSSLTKLSLLIFNMNEFVYVD